MSRHYAEFLSTSLYCPKGILYSEIRTSKKGTSQGRQLTNEKKARKLSPLSTQSRETTLLIS